MTRPLPQRPHSPWRALVIAALSPCVGLSVAACDPDPAPLCAQAYEHLLTVSSRNHTDDLKARFVERCVQAYDEYKVRCLLSAETPADAARCRTKRGRPT